mgnify:CR=1
MNQLVNKLWTLHCYGLQGFKARFRSTAKKVKVAFKIAVVIAIGASLFTFLVH